MCCTVSGSEWQSLIDADKNRPQTNTPEEDSQSKLVKIGVFTDAHYSATKASTAERYYQASADKIRDAVKTFNSEGVDMVISLGDIVDNDYSSFNDIGLHLSTLEMPLYNLMGNHDFESPYSETAYLESLNILGMKSRYHSIVINGIRLIFIDTSDIATYSHPFESAGYRKAVSILDVLKDDGAANAKKYNGALGSEQLDWLAGELKAADSASETVVCFCHIPFAAEGADRYTVWNSEEVIDLLGEHSCVKAVVAGHHHAGGYAKTGNVHHLTLKGMVAGEENSYSILKISENNICVDGFGRESDAEYKFE